MASVLKAFFFKKETSPGSVSPSGGAKEAPEEGI